VVPVAACLGLGSDGELYNINADHMAAAAAEGLALMARIRQEARLGDTGPRPTPGATSPSSP
jgi:hypothetical protein